VILALLGAVQIALAGRVALRFVKTAPGQRITACREPVAEAITVILPVLNEAPRIAPCLETLIRQPLEVVEILVVDGGSTDGTQAIVERFRARDRRIRLIQATPDAGRWTGKARSLYVGLQRTRARSGWVLSVDADVRCSPDLVRSLLHHARRRGLAALSVATTQRLAGAADALVHPAFLGTIVYRLGAPGHEAKRVDQVQANGQCFLARRNALLRTDAVRAARHSLCEDMTMARRLAECGERVGFYLGEGLVEVSMYGSWRDTWRNWPRSLAMRDQYFGWRGVLGLAEVLLVQAVPLPAVLLASAAGRPRWFMMANLALLLMRIGVLAGMAPAYRCRPWSYWLSPLMDLPAALRLIGSTVQKHQVWRGQAYIRRRGGRFEPLHDSDAAAQPRRHVRRSVQPDER
jgi:dolichol-phosphate mannosyltransferase